MPPRKACKGKEDDGPRTCWHKDRVTFHCPYCEMSNRAKKLVGKARSMHAHELARVAVSASVSAGDASPPKPRDGLTSNFESVLELTVENIMRAYKEELQAKCEEIYLLKRRNEELESIVESYKGKLSDARGKIQAAGGADGPPSAKKRKSSGNKEPLLLATPSPSRTKNH